MSKPSVSIALLAGALIGAGVAAAPDPGATTLLARHGELRQELGDNQFQRPLVLGSSTPAGRLQGDVYARLDRPFAAIDDALQSMDHWCDILILHLNVKGCRASVPPTADTLSVYLGRKTEQALGDAERIDFRFQRQVTQPGYLSVVLAAASGPYGTSDYRITVEAVPLSADQSFIHLTYSYSYGTVAGWAMRAYLATSGRSKVGFSIIGQRDDGTPIRLGGVRGVVERNTMRYYLAIEAYLGALGAPAAAQVAQRLNDWHDSIERYPLQLHELERADYLAMKHREIQRQDAFSAAGVPD